MALTCLPKCLAHCESAPTKVFLPCTLVLISMGSLTDATLPSGDGPRTIRCCKLQWLAWKSASFQTVLFELQSRGIMAKLLDAIVG